MNITNNFKRTKIYYWCYIKYVNVKENGIISINYFLNMALFYIILYFFIFIFNPINININISDS